MKLTQTKSHLDGVILNHLLKKKMKKRRMEVLTCMKDPSPPLPNQYPPSNVFHCSKEPNNQEQRWVADISPHIHNNSHSGKMFFKQGEILRFRRTLMMVNVSLLAGIIGDKEVDPRYMQVVVLLTVVEGWVGDSQVQQVEAPPVTSEPTLSKH